MLDSFRMARYRFDLEAVDPIRLPAHQSSTFRGGFGHAFKKMVCIRPDWGACTPCGRKNECPYGYIFETTAPNAQTALPGAQEVTPPFVIEAPSGVRREYGPGDRLGFDVVLVGRALNYLPYFLLAFQELGRAGLGREPGRYVLQRISAIHPWRAEQELVYDGVDVRVGGRDLSASYAEVAAWAESLPPDRLTLRFLTPTRIKHQNTYVAQPSFYVLARALVRRIQALSYYHCGEDWQPDFRAIMDAAARVETARAALAWEEWERFSGRQQQAIKLGGFVGEITYAGAMAELRPLLALGALVHIGKATVFGNGRYEVSR